MSYKRHFSRFLAADPGRLHVAAHSHHFWPDVTFAAQERCWQDAARLADRKWETVFGEVIPRAQGHVARLLNLPDPATVAFGPNTHGFVLRLLSLFPPGRPVRVLTTDGEFHSFARQIRRLAEDGLAQVTYVASEPLPTLAERFIAAARGGHDLVFVSHVLFNSGYAFPDLAVIADAAEGDTLVAIDGYHGFLALPTDLGSLAGRVFYLAGGFGRHLKVDASKRIGLIPNLPNERIVQVGNAAIEGACIALLSKTKRQELEQLVLRVEHCRLETHPSFFDFFVEGCQFKPVESHTAERVG